VCKNLLLTVAAHLLWQYTSTSM